MKHLKKIILGLLLIVIPFIKVNANSISKISMDIYICIDILYGNSNTNLLFSNYQTGKPSNTNSHCIPLKDHGTKKTYMLGTVAALRWYYAIML